jgi:hypothetical protein
MDIADEPLHEDPEIAALLDFEPVPRKCPRRGGWSPENQRGYIVGLAVTGNVERAADAVGLTGNGAYQLRKCVGAEGFADAWAGAVALYKARQRGRTAAPRVAAGRPGVAAAIDEVSWQEFADGLLRKYWIKLEQERRARLAGDIVEADFCVRQLTWVEVALDLGGNAVFLLKELKRGGHHVGNIVATPMSVLLDSVRRAYWAEKGEPDRPPMPPLGEHDGEVSTGVPQCYMRERDGPDYKAFRQREVQEAGLAAEAQRAWEEKARADAAAWRVRLEAEADGDSDPS